MLVPADLASVLKDGIGQIISTGQVDGFAQAICETFTTTGIITNPPGTITGVAPASGGPLSNGAGVGGIITGITGAGLAALVALYAGYPSITPELQGFCDAMANHFITGIVVFPVGTITGVCGNTPASPGPLVGEGAMGEITGYSGPILATAMAGGLGQGGPSPEVVGFATNLVTYLMDNAEANYATGSVTGTCPAGGGPIPDGAGVAGFFL